MSTRLPRLLTASLAEKARLRPTAMSVTLEMMGTSTATMTLEESDATVKMHDWVEVFTPNGSAGIFRVTNIEDTKRQQRDVTLMHAIDTLSDSVWHGQTDFDGTVQGFLTSLLNQQPVAYWQLGTCADNGAWKKAGINYDRLSDLLEEVRSDRYGFNFTYDFTTSPWTLNLVANSATVVSEFRLARNVENCRITRTDGEQCNRLYLSVSHKTTSSGVTTTETEVKTYNNTASQNTYGIIEKTADIDLENVPSADAWAADFLAQRAQPMVQISIDAYSLRQITGESWDEAKLGRMARVALPDYAEALEERVVTIRYPDLDFGDGIERVTVELANHLAKFSETIASVQKQSKAAGKAARKAGRGGASAEELEQWAVVVTHHGEVIEETGLIELHESGIEVDAQSGVRVYSLLQGTTSQRGILEIHSDEIEARVEKNGVISAINQTAESITISASKINLQGYVTASDLEAVNARINNLISGNISFTNLVGTKGSFNQLYLGGSQLSRTTYTINGVTYNLVTWYGSGS